MQMRDAIYLPRIVFSPDVSKSDRRRVRWKKPISNKIPDNASKRFIILGELQHCVDNKRAVNLISDRVKHPECDFGSRPSSWRKLCHFSSAKNALELDVEEPDNFAGTLAPRNSSWYPTNDLRLDFFHTARLNTLYRKSIKQFSIPRGVIVMQETCLTSKKSVIKEQTMGHLQNLIGTYLLFSYRIEPDAVNWLTQNSCWLNL